MMLLDKKVLFIHIPKCAGTSIEVFFAGKDWSEISPRTKHLTAREALKRYGRDIWDACFKFSIVRNPWARYLSYFNFLRQRDLLRRGKSRLQFEPWIRRVCRWGLRDSGIRVERSMSEYLVGRDGELMVDFVGRVENLGEDFRTIVERVGVPPGPLRREMATQYDRDYRKWYTPELRDVVGERYREDIERFGYDF
jgi:hypothetical protein